MAVVLVLLVAYFIFPGRYKYTDDGAYITKLDRLSGNVSIYSYADREWSK